MSSGGGGGGSSGFQQTTSETVVPDWVQNQVTQNIGTANTLAAQPYQAFQGPTVAGLTPDQLQAYSEIENLPSTAPTYAQAIGNVSNLPAATQSLLNPYMNLVGGDTVSNIQRASAQSQNAANANAAGVSAFGGARSGVQSDVLASETQRNIGQAINQIQAQGWNTASSLALQQAQEMGQLTTAKQQADLLGAGALSQVGGQEQAQTQAEYSAALQQWQQQQNYPYQQLAVQQSALAGSPYGNTVVSQQPYTTNPVATALGETAAGLGIVNQLGKWTGLFNTPNPTNTAGTAATTGASTGTSAMPTFNAGTAPTYTDPVAGYANASDAAASAASKGGSGATTFG